MTTVVGLPISARTPFLSQYRVRTQLARNTLWAFAGSAFSQGSSLLAGFVLGRMGDHGLEWLYRFCREPRRLWRRSVISSSAFVYYCLREMLFGDSTSRKPSGQSKENAL